MPCDAAVMMPIHWAAPHLRLLLLQLAVLQPLMCDFKCWQVAGQQAAPPCVPPPQGPQPCPGSANAGSSEQPAPPRSWLPSVEDHPVYQGTPCPGRLWQPNEIPRVHTIELDIAPGDFRWLVDNQALTNPLARNMPTNITFDGRLFPGGGLKVHGGWYQRGGPPPPPPAATRRGGSPAPTSWGQAEGDGSGLRGLDCFLRDDPTAASKCKPSWRLRFSKHHPFNAVFPSLFRFPADKQLCNDPQTMTLRNEWTDRATRAKNKLVLDMVKAAGGLAARVEFARLVVNGEFFGFYALEEHLGAHWARCFGLDPHATLPNLPADPTEVQTSTLLKSSTGHHWTGGGAPGDGATWPATCTLPNGRPLLCSAGFERKLPECKHCNNDDIAANADHAAYPECDCGTLPQLDALFAVVGGAHAAGTKQQVQNLVNMTAAFIFQAIVVLTGDIDTMNHNYYMYKQPGSPWAVILCDADQAFGINGRPARSMADLHGQTYLPNAFFRVGGTMARLFDHEYARFLTAVVALPQLSPCAVGDAWRVLLDPSTGVLTAAIAEDAARWGPHVISDSHYRSLDATIESASERIRAVAAVASAAAPPPRNAGGGDGSCVTCPIGFTPPGRVRCCQPVAPVAPRPALVSCGTAQPGEVGEFCAAAGFTKGICVQGSLYPACIALPPPDACGCAHGSGWDKSLGGGCVLGAHTSAAEASSCTGAGSDGQRLPDGGRATNGCLPQQTSPALCTTAALGFLTDAYCPVAANSAAFVPESCPLTCASPFVGWWQQCQTHHDIVTFDERVDGQLSHYFTRCMAQLLACGWVQSEMPAGAGH